MANGNDPRVDQIVGRLRGLPLNELSPQRPGTDWITVQNNGVEPGALSDQLRIVFQEPGLDIAYVPPIDGNNGNSIAEFIANAPSDLWYLLDLLRCCHE